MAILSGNGRVMLYNGSDGSASPVQVRVRVRLDRHGVDAGATARDRARQAKHPVEKWLA